MSDMIDIAITKVLMRSPVSLHLDGVLELDFEEKHRCGRIKSLSIGIFIVTLLSVLCLPFDLSNGIFLEGLELRIGLQMPLAVCSIILLRRSKSSLHECVAVGACLATIIGCTVFLGQHTGNISSERYTMAAGLLCVAFNLTFPMKFAQTLCICFSNLVVFNVLIALSNGGNSTVQNMDLNEFFSLIVVATLWTASQRVRSDQEAYVLRLRDQRRCVQLSEFADEMKRLAHVDTLTGVGNRRSFELRYTSAWEQAKARGAEIAIILIDVDNFKRFNDTVGHAAGDKCLRSVASAIVDAVRCDPTRIGRYGGEEFAVILTCSDGENWEKPISIAERIRSTVYDLNIFHPGEQSGGRVSVSIGVAVANLTCSKISRGDLIERADKELYRAKKEGRNRVCANI